MTILEERAWAKLNLSLAVLGKRPDGYHELDMVMQSVSLCDEVHIAVSDSGPWSVIGENMPLDQSNLAWKAAEAYFEGISQRPGLAIAIEKRIPSQAGLGGGSADAAAVLRALNRHYGFHSPEELARRALIVGSDVPYCLAGGTKRAGGRGERLSALQALPDCAIVIVKPSCACSTAALYAAIDREPEIPQPDTSALLDALDREDLPAIGASLCNAFEPLASREHPQIAALLAQLRGSGCLGAAMTGSGSACFALYGEEAAARRAADDLKAADRQIFLARPV